MIAVKGENEIVLKINQSELTDISEGITMLHENLRIYKEVIEGGIETLNTCNCTECQAEECPNRDKPLDDKLLNLKQEANKTLEEIEGKMAQVRGLALTIAAIPAEET